MEYKVILSGHFEFGSKRSFEKALGIYLHKLEKAYKNDVIIKEETAFDEEKFIFSVNRLTGTVIDRTWRNTISVLELLAEFAKLQHLHRGLFRKLKEIPERTNG